MTAIKKNTGDIAELEEFVTQTAIDNPDIRKVLLLSRDFVVAINANLLEGQPHTADVIADSLKCTMDGFVTAVIACFGLSFAPGTEGVASESLSKVFALLLDHHIKTFAEFRPGIPAKENVDG